MEEWKSIKGFEGVYEISSLGRVRSLKFNKKRILAMLPQRNGVLRAYLESFPKYIHHLVMEAFGTPAPHAGMYLRHRESKTDNRVENLVWMTVADSVEMDLTRRTNPNIRITEREVVQIRKLADKGATYYSLAKRFGYKPDNISRICRGVSWTHISGPVKNETRTSFHAKLDEQKVLDILVRRQNGETQAEIAKAMKVEQATISCVCLGQTWKHVKGKRFKRFEMSTRRKS